MRCPFYFLALLFFLPIGVNAQLQQVGSTTSAGGQVTPTGSPYRHIGIAGQPASTGHAAFANGGSGNFGLLNVSQICAPVQTTDAATICAGESYAFGNQTLTTADTYVETFTAANGCDSTVTLALSVADSYGWDDVQTLTARGSECEPGGFPVNGTYTRGPGDINGKPYYVHSSQIWQIIWCDVCSTNGLDNGNPFGWLLTDSEGQEGLYYNPTDSDFPPATGWGPYLDGITPCDEPAPVFTLISEQKDQQSICAGQSYTFGNQTLTEPGDYTELFTNGSGCDSLVTLTLTVLDAIETSDAATICAGESYTFGSQTLTAADTYVETFTAANGCDSTVTLTLNVNETFQTTDAVTINEGESYTFGSQTLTTADTYVETFTAANGCDSTVTLTLTVNGAIQTSDAATICAGESYIFGTQTLTTADTYVETFTATSGADSTVTLTLTVEETFQTADAATICAGESYTFGTQTLTAADTYVETFTAANGCDSTVTLTLTVEETIQTSIAATICEGESYTFGSQTLTAADTYVETFTAANDCDSTVTLTLTVEETIQTTDAATICAGESYTFGNQTLTTADTYVETFTGSGGCDSTVTLTLTVLEAVQAVDAATICAGGSYPFGSQKLTETGVYTETFPAANGCDSIVTLSLTVNETFQTSDAVSICAGESYTFGSQTLTTADTYVETFTATNGCDSTVTLTLAVNDAFQVIDAATICAGESYAFGSQTLTAGGNYIEIFTAANGCDSTVALVLTVMDAYQTTDAATICAGESYPFGSQTLTTTDTYVETFTAANGCDSTVTLTLTVEETIQTTAAATICAGESYTFGSQTLTTTDTYVETFTAASGCDSTVTLTLTVNETFQTSDAATICPGESYAFGAQNLTAAGTYVETFTAANGCDSTVTLTLSVNEAIQTTDAATICPGQSYSFGNQSLTTPGTYVETFPAANGCDSTVTLTLSLGDGIEVMETATICAGDSYVLGDQILTQPGQYSETFPTGSDCDSTVNLTLLVAEPVTTFDTIRLCVGERFNYGNLVFSEPGDYPVIFPAVNSPCDSTVLLTVEIIEPIPDTEIFQSICAGEAYPFDGQELTTSGVYSAAYLSSEGCDSTVVLTLDVLPTPTVTETVAICAGDTYAFGDQELSEAGTYSATFSSAAGCDSTVTLTLELLPNPSSSETVAICEGEAYPFGNEMLTTAGVYAATFSSAAGCDSTVTLTLEVLSSPTVMETAAICDGETYAFGDQELTESGIYSATFAAASGCDSTVTLTLEVGPTIETPLGVTICAGSSFAFDGQILTESGLYSATFSSSTFCDSIVNLNLTVLPAPTTNETVFICTGESYVFGSDTLSQSGIYTETLKTSNNCDSTVILSLTVADALEVADTAFICPGEQYTFGTQLLDSTGTYTETFSGSINCDSIVTLVLFVVEDEGYTASATICGGQSYTFGSQVLTESGEYTEVFSRAETGCDSTVTLTLTQIDALAAMADSYTLTLTTSTSISGNVTENDILEAGGGWQILLAAPPELGRLDLLADGRFTYTVDEPLPTTPTEDSFDYLLFHPDCPDSESVVTVRLRLRPEPERTPEVIGITPNGDGLNDFFVIPELRDRSADFPENELLIYNRWGSLVFRANPYSNDWDGTGLDGRLLPAGTYFFVLRLDIGEGELRKGQVVLVR